MDQDRKENKDSKDSKESKVSKVSKDSREPALRFKGFEGEWEEKKLGSLCDITTGKLDANAMVIDGQYDFYTSGKEVYKIDKAAFEGPAITIAGNGASVGFIHLADGEFNAYQRTYILTNFTEERLFLHEAITLNLPLKISEEVRGSGIPYIVQNMLTDLVLLCPSRQEQISVGSFLTSLDQFISFQRQKLDKLEDFKKAMFDKMFPQKGSRVPELRFKGFTDPWQEQSFEDLFDCTVPTNTFSRAKLSYSEGTVLNVHYGDVLIKYGSILDVKNDQIPRILQKNRNDFVGALLQDGDVIFADTAEDESAGKACEIMNSQGKAIVSGLHTVVCRPRNQMALGYLGYYLNSPSYHHQLIPLMQGIKVLSLTKSSLQKTMVGHPISLDEQSLIGQYFSQLDHLLSLHRQKLEKLQSLKKAMLGQMFPAPPRQA